MTPRQPVSIVREDYRGWSDTWRLSNRSLETRVVTAVGPRIIDLRIPGGENLFHVRAAEAGGRGEAQWMLRGGWRLWVAPERRETTYALDNAPCTVQVIDGRTLRVTAPPQPAAGIQKVVEVTLADDAPRLAVRSIIHNRGATPLTIAAWSLSVMRAGGRALAPLDVGRLDAFDATRKLILWSYTQLADPRYALADDLVQVDQSRVRPAPAANGQQAPPRRADESKIGVDSGQGWAAYLHHRTLYLKSFPHHPAGIYPDGGATVEIYSSAEFLELENLSPLTQIPPGGTLVYPEEWWIFADVDLGAHPRSGLARYLAESDSAETPH